MADSRNVPVPSPSLDRAAVERVLARAAELHGTGDTSSTDALTEAEIVEIAREAGLSTAHVRQAIAEERTRVTLPSESGLAARLAGPGWAGASRLVSGTRARVIGSLDQWLESDGCMQVQRRQPERTIWQPRRDVVGNLRRGLRGGDGRALQRIQSLVVTVTDAGDNRVLVRLDADLSRSRHQRLVLSGTTASVGTLAGASMLGVGIVAHALLAVVVPIAIIPMAAGAGAAALIARGGRAAAEDVQTTLERVLDRLEQGELPPGRSTPLLDVLQEVRRALR